LSLNYIFSHVLALSLVNLVLELVLWKEMEMLAATVNVGTLASVAKSVHQDILEIHYHLAVVTLGKRQNATHSELKEFLLTDAVNVNEKLLGHVVTNVQLVHFT
jgi:hypothetical protein